MTRIIASIVVLLGLVARADGPAVESSPVPRKSDRLPTGATPVHPEAFSSGALWRAVAKADPPSEWQQVITPDNRKKFPADFTLHVFTNGETATFRFACAQTDLDTMVRRIELFEPDPTVLDSPRADKGLVSIRVQTRQDQRKDVVLCCAEFTYPTKRLSKTYLRVTTAQGRLWPISLLAFWKKPDPVAAENEDSDIKIRVDNGRR